MAALSAAVGYAILVGVHTVIAAVTTRFFRIRMETHWGSALYTVVFVPMVLIASTLLLSGPLGIGTAAGTRTTAVMIVIVVPMILGYAIDFFWMPAPEEVELPDRDRSRE